MNNAAWNSQLRERWILSYQFWNIVLLLCSLCAWYLLRFGLYFVSSWIDTGENCIIIGRNIFSYLNRKTYKVQKIITVLIRGRGLIHAIWFSGLVFTCDYTYDSYNWLRLHIIWCTFILDGTKGKMKYKGLCLFLSLMKTSVVGRVFLVASMGHHLTTNVGDRGAEGMGQGN